MIPDGPQSLVERFIVWLRNSVHFHECVMADFLRDRGWVVFYLDEQAWHCNDVCWLKLYTAQQAGKPDAAR